MSEKHLPYIGGNFDRIVFNGDGSTWVREQLGTHYSELFGTPERAARTLAGIVTADGCVDCALLDATCCRNKDAWLEWLRGDAE